MRRKAEAATLLGYSDTVFGKYRNTGSPGWIQVRLDEALAGDTKRHVREGTGAKSSRRDIMALVTQLESMSSTS